MMIEGVERKDLGAASHFPIVASAIAQTTGPILECGSGDFSTPLIHFLAKDRLVVTAETDPDWMKQFEIYKSPTHEFHFIGNGSKAKSEEDGAKEWQLWKRIEEVQWDVALIDHCPGGFRYELVHRLKGRCKYVICHDIEEIFMDPVGNPRGYHWDRALGLFKYQYVWKQYVPYTMVLSDEEMFKP
jgi:hypothetical protein